jgi:predicted transport protein
MLFVLINKPFVLLLTDQERPELEEIMMTYASNWGKFVKPILIRKYADNNELFCTMSPTFVEIDFNNNGKIVKEKQDQKPKLTEADHLESSSDVIQAIYQTIKTDLLKVDASIEFNPKQYYVSMRKGKNLAFFHIKKKLISLVVMHSETETRKQIKHHEVKTLTEKVQQFWNGASCSIVIDSLEELDEVTALLKKLIQ